MNESKHAARVVLVRHGETEWSLNGRHTSVTDLPLTAHGRDEARALAPTLAKWRFAAVLSSPRCRAVETCELAGLGEHRVSEEDAVEWDYGDYEGTTSPEIHRHDPDWTVFTHGCPGGESPADIEQRVDRLIVKLRAEDGDVAVFAHGHISRVIAARWIGLPVAAGVSLDLNTATLNVLGYYKQFPAILIWNAPLPGA